VACRTGGLAADENSHVLGDTPSQAAQGLVARVDDRGPRLRFPASARLVLYSAQRPD
jgi:hypothetical protein